MDTMIEMSYQVPDLPDSADIEAVLALVPEVETMTWDEALVEAKRRSIESAHVLELTATD
jgi:hypothetical protein